jgi:pimeloyl-ACP methyl ester carboxylesterase
MLSHKTGIKNIVFVHGAWADGSSWSKVIPKLQAKGFNVVAVQNPVTSLADDVAATKRIIALQDGPVLLVGHSWGGVVITEAGNDPKVAGLVYVAAFAPGDGQSINDINKDPAPGLAEVKLDAGFLRLTPKGMAEYFAQDLTVEEKHILFAVQGQTAASIFDAKVSVAAWKTKPSWYVVASNDRMILPKFEESLAKTINATTITVSASHVAMLSQPTDVANFIAKAASSFE